MLLKVVDEATEAFLEATGGEVLTQVMSLKRVWS